MKILFALIGGFIWNILKAVSSNEHEPNTSVYIMGGGLCHVMETVDEIKKKINEASHIKLTTYETGPR